MSSIFDSNLFSSKDWDIISFSAIINTCCCFLLFKIKSNIWGNYISKLFDVIQPIHYDADTDKLYEGDCINFSNSGIKLS